MRIGAHPAQAHRRERRQLRHQTPIAIEQFFSLVALHPAFEQRHMFRMLRVHEQRHLMRPEGSSI